MIETLVTATLLLAATITLVPLISQLNSEQKALSEKREMANELHDRLQPFLWTETTELPKVVFNEDGKSEAKFSFEMYSDFIKGCVYWKNALQREEEFCLFGIPSP